MAQDLAGVKFTSDTVAPEFKLGNRASKGDGSEYIYVKAAATIAASSVCIILVDGTATPVTTTNAAGNAGQGSRLGVASTTGITSGRYGWLCIYANALSGITANVAASCVKYTQLCTTGTGGVLDDALVAAGTVWGLVATTTATGAAAVVVEISYPVTVLN